MRDCKAKSPSSPRECSKTAKPTLFRALFTDETRQSLWLSFRLYMYLYDYHFDLPFRGLANS